MKKTLSALLLLTMLLTCFSPIATAYAEDEYYPEEYIPSKFMTVFSVSIDGVLCDPPLTAPDSLYIYENRLPAAYILRNLGFDVSFDEASNTVSAIKGDMRIVLYLTHASVLVQTGDHVQEYSFMCHEFYGTSYVTNSFFSQIFGYYVALSYGPYSYDPETNTHIEHLQLTLSDLSSYGQQLADLLNANLQRAKDLDLDLSVPIRYSMSSDFLFDSPVFGINAKGNITYDLQIARTDDGYFIDMKLGTEGLGNLMYDLTYKSGMASLYMPDFSAIDFDSPIEFKIIVDDTATYMKLPGLQAKYVTTLYNYHYLETAEQQLKAQTAWLKSPAAVPAIKSGLSAQDGVAILVSMMPYESSMPTVFCEKMISLLQNLSDKSIVTQNDETGQVSIDMNIDKEWLYQQASAIASSFPLGYYNPGHSDLDAILAAQQASVDQFFDMLEFDMVNNETYQDGLLTTGTMRISAKLLNIPNAWNLPIGTFTFESKADYYSDQSIIMDTTIPAPDDCVDAYTLRGPNDPYPEYLKG